jgi:esterase/lipase superfamily enzyme
MRAVSALMVAVFAFAAAGGSFARADEGPAIPLVRVRAGAPLAYELVRGGPCAGRRTRASETPVSAAAFARALGGRGVARTIVFVPGFATSVSLAYAAARRIARTLGPADRVVFVDWGSAGRKSAYERDARTAHRNAPMLSAALLAIRALAPHRELDVFAHSLGTRVVAMAIPTFPASDGVVVANMVLAAPDMTVDDYRRAIARVPGPFRHVTLYVSRLDRALLLSEIVHLHRRLGLITHWQRALANTDVVDASAASRGTPDGHGYAIDEPALIADVGLTLAGAPVPHRAWRTETGAGSSTWVLALPPAAIRVASDSCAAVAAKAP